MINIFSFLDTSRYSECIVCGRREPKTNFSVSHNSIGICKVCNDNVLPFVPVGKTFDGKGYINNVMSVFFYKHPMTELIRRYKFSRCRDYGDVFSEYMTSLLIGWFGDELPFDLIVPVPLSEKSFKNRGYNQSEILANNISKDVGIPYSSDCLVKIKETKTQSTLGNEERLTNVKNAFSATNAVCDKQILLIDDVYTTGATTDECAKALKEKGALSVDVMTVARSSVNTHSKYYNELIGNVKKQ